MSYIYLLNNPAMPRSVKIGMTTRSPYERAKELATTGVPESFNVVDFWEVDPSDLHQVEKDLHKALASKRQQSNREFFKIKPEVARKFIQDFLNERGELEELRKEAQKSKAEQYRALREHSEKRQVALSELSNTIKDKLLKHGVLFERLRLIYPYEKVIDLHNQYLSSINTSLGKKKTTASWTVSGQLDKKHPSILIILNIYKAAGFFSSGSHMRPLFLRYNVITGKLSGKGTHTDDFRKFINFPSDLEELLSLLRLTEATSFYCEMRKKVTDLNPKMPPNSYLENHLCPTCHNGKLVLRRRRSDNHPFLGCSKYPKCKFTADIPIQS